MSKFEIQKRVSIAATSQFERPDGFPRNVWTKYALAALTAAVSADGDERASELQDRITSLWMTTFPLRDIESARRCCVYAVVDYASVRRSPWVGELILRDSWLAPDRPKSTAMLSVSELAARSLNIPFLNVVALGSASTG